MKGFAGRFLKKGSFLQNVSIASGWNIAIIASQLCLSPIITRLYGPAEYGTYALFNSIMVNVVMISSFKYNETIVIAETDDERDANLILAISIIILTSILSLVALVIGNATNIWELPGNGYFYLLPLTVFITSVLELLIAFNVRSKAFFFNGMAGFMTGTFSRGANIVYALIFSAQSAGLIFGDLIGKSIGLVANLFYIGRYKAICQAAKSATIRSLRDAAIKYRRYPLYFMPSSALLYVSGFIPIYFLQFKYGATAVGAFALATSLLEIFNRLIPYALSPVFLQKALEMKSESHELLSRQVFKLATFMLGLATCIYGLFIVIAEPLFPIVFGHEWIEAGKFASLLTFHYTFNFVAVSLSEVYNVLGRQRFLFYNSVGNLILRVIAVVVIALMDVGVHDALLIYSVLSGLAGLMLIAGVFVVLRYRILNIIALLFLSFLLLIFGLVIKEFLPQVIWT